MEDKEATGVVSLPHQVVSFFHFAEVELVDQKFSDVGRQVAEGEVWDQRVWYDLFVLWFLLSEDVGELLINELLAIIFECS